jgi:hypothetical protein
MAEALRPGDRADHQGDFTPFGWAMSLTAGSILGGHLGVIDDESVDGILGGFELEA